MTAASVLYSSRAHLNEQDVARLVQASVYLADSVWLPDTAAVDPTLPNDRRLALTRRLDELRDIGALKRWGIESAPTGLTSASYVVSLERYQAMYDVVLDRLMANRVKFLGDAGGSFDGITEIVLGKQAFWHFELCDELQADGLLYDNASSRNLGRFVSNLLGRLSEADEVVKELTLRLNLPDVSAFSVEKLVACREHMPAFRADILNRLASVTGRPGVTSKELIDKVASAVVSDYHAYVHAARAGEASDAGAQRSVWTRLWSVVELLLRHAPVSPHQDASIFDSRDRADGRPPPQLLLLDVMKTNAPH